MVSVCVSVCHQMENCSNVQYIKCVCDDDILLLEKAETLQKGINVLLLCLSRSNVDKQYNRVRT